MKAVIMAGGVGKRLRPLTCDCPKPMTPMMNRPVMAYSLELLEKHSAQDIAVTLQYLPNQVMDHFGDGSDYGVRLHYYVENKPLGTAGSVRQAAGMLDETFAVISGDALTDIDLSSAFEFHKARGSICTLVLKRVEVPVDYGIVQLDENSRVSRFYEKPGWEEIYSDLANTGIYIVEPEALGRVKPDTFTDFAKDLFPGLLQDGCPMYGYVAQGYWCDVGDINQYLQAHRDILDGRCSVRLNARRVGGAYIENGAFLDAAAVVNGPCYIGSGSWIGPGARLGPYSVLGCGVKLERGASVKRSVLWDGVTVRNGAQVRGAVLCNGVTLKDGAAAFEEAAIGSHSVVGESSVIKPGVFVWPSKRIEPELSLGDDCVWGGGEKTRLFENGAVSGGIELELSPPAALKLGAALALSLKGARSVGVGSDGQAQSVAVKQALVAGLLSYGADVYDLERLTMPMLRFGVRTLSLTGGVTISKNAQNERLTLRIVEEDGAAISPGLQRSVQGAFERLDIRPERGPMIGLLRMRRELSPFYRAELCRLCGETLRAAHKSMLIGGDGLTQGILLEIFHGFGWSCALSKASGEGFAREVIGARCDAGFLIGDDGETLSIVDDSGNTIGGGSIKALLAFAHVNMYRAKELALPLGTPDAIAAFFTARGIRTKLVKSDGASLYREMMKLTPELAFAWFDAAAGALSVARCMAHTGLLVSEMLSLLPQYHMCTGFVPCSWRDVGRILRELSEGAPKQRTQCIEGVRVRHDGGWALVRPSLAGAGFNVLSEGASAEYAQELTDLYVSRVQALKSEDIKTR